MLATVRLFSDIMLGVSDRLSARLFVWKWTVLLDTRARDTGLARADTLLVTLYLVLMSGVCLQFALPSRQTSGRVELYTVFTLSSDLYLYCLWYPELVPLTLPGSVDLQEITLILRDPEKPESSGVLLLVVSSLLEGDPVSLLGARAVLPLNASFVVGVEVVCFFSLVFLVMFPTEFLLGLEECVLWSGCDSERLTAVPAVLGRRFKTLVFEPRRVAV